MPQHQLSGWILERALVARVQLAEMPYAYSQLQLLCFYLKAVLCVTLCIGTQTRPLVNTLPKTNLPSPAKTKWKKPQNPVVMPSLYFSFSLWQEISDPGRSAVAKVVLSHRNCLVRSCPYLSDPMKLPGYSAANPYSVCFSNIWFRDTLALTASAPGAKSPDLPFLWWSTFDQFSEHLWFFLELFFAPCLTWCHY